jgi:hypothetical protein
MSWMDHEELFAGLDAAPLRAVELSPDKERITFTLESGASIAFGVEGDCCSHSWIEHLDVPPYVLGETITTVEGGDGVPWDGHVCVPNEPDADGYAYGNQCDHESLQVYSTRFRTAKGDIVLEYRNDSNGYYGGYLVRL